MDKGQNACPAMDCGLAVDEQFLYAVEYVVQM